MKHLLAALLLTASLSTTWAADAPAAPAADDSKFVLSTSSKPAPVDPAKASVIKEGMTLQALVEALGPGWVANSGNGIIQWNFTDGRTLSILSEHNDKLDLVTFKGNGSGTLAWWSKPVSATPSKGSASAATVP